MRLSAFQCVDGCGDDALIERANNAIGAKVSLAAHDVRRAGCIQVFVACVLLQDFRYCL